MRDIRARIVQRHGIDLSAQQVQELAARRLEAILDPRNVSPNLLQQLQKGAGERQAKDSAAAAVPYAFEDTTIYDSHRGLLRAIRKLLNPILRLFFNPNTIIHALNAQTRLNAQQAARDGEREQRQAEWNALHYELLRRVVTESARSSLELQALALRVESLVARVDFTDRRVRALEAAPAQRHGGRAPQEPHPAPTTQVTVPAAAAEKSVDVAPVAGASAEPLSDGQRKRRRRRRGRRSGGSFAEGSQSQPASAATSDNGPEEFDDVPDDASNVGDDGEPNEAPNTISLETAPDRGGDARPAPQSVGPVAAPAPVSTPISPDKPGSSESTS